jgi:tRNA A-37 threonylcarbamoyl transferase component Bud32
LKARRTSTALGRLAWLGDPALLGEALALCAEASRSPHGVARAVELGGARAWFKGSGYPRHALWRHALARALGRAAPRLVEHANLAWLRAHGFGAPEPLIAGQLVRRGLPRYQFLATREVPGARGLRASLDAPPAERGALLERLAADVGRMHALGFEHGDLFPRNVLVARGAVASQEPVFLDAWSAGPGAGERGAARDLGSWFVYAASLLSRDEQRAFAERYLAERELDRTLGARILASAARERARAARRERRRARTDEGEIAESWNPAELGERGRG